MDQPFSVSWNICLHNPVSVHPFQHVKRPGAFRHDCVARFQSLPWRVMWLKSSKIRHLFSTLNETPPERQVILFPRLMVASSEDEARVWPWVFTTSEHRKNPVPWWSGKSLPKKNKGALPFKIVRLIHVTESHLQQFLGRPASKADASHR